MMKNDVQMYDYFWEQRKKLIEKAMENMKDHMVCSDDEWHRFLATQVVDRMLLTRIFRRYQKYSNEPIGIQLWKIANELIAIYASHQDYSDDILKNLFER